MLLLNPAVIALLAASCLVTLFTLYACGLGVRILWQWDPDDSSERQLLLERKTYLISSILSHVLIIELVSLFLFVAVANQLHTLFTGAMCAAGVFNAAPFGNLSLVVRTVSFLCCGVWLVVHQVDARAWDYPLVRFKYSFLLAVGLLLAAEGVLQGMFLAGLNPQVLTSCCGTIFDEASGSLVSGMAHLPAKTAAGYFYLGMGLNLAVGAWFAQTGRYGWLYGLLSLAVFLLSIAALISFFCLYVYEMPTHHCPFCMLQGEYHYIGYLLYGLLLAGAIAGISTAVVGRFGAKTLQRDLIQRVQKQLCLGSMLAYGLFTLRVTYAVVFSDFKLTGY